MAGRRASSKLTAENVSFWDRSAKRYDRFVRWFIPGYSALAKRIAGDASTDGRVLEVAAGTGLITVELARRAAQVDATDASDRMVETLRRKVTMAGLENVSVSLQNAYSLDFEDQIFAAAVCANALHIMRHPGSALDEMRRVLEPGGRLIAPTYAHAETLTARVASRLASLTGFRVYHRFTAESLRQLIESRGFTVTTFEVMRSTPPLVYAVAKLQSRRGGVGTQRSECPDA